MWKYAPETQISGILVRAVVLGAITVGGQLATQLPVLAIINICWRYILQRFMVTVVGLKIKMPLTQIYHEPVYFIVNSVR